MISHPFPAAFRDIPMFLCFFNIYIYIFDFCSISPFMIRWCLVYFPSLLSCIFPFDLMIRFVGQAGPSPWLLGPILEMNNDKGKAYKNTQKKTKKRKTEIVPTVQSQNLQLQYQNKVTTYLMSCPVVLTTCLSPIST